MSLVWKMGVIKSPVGRVPMTITPTIMHILAPGRPLTPRGSSQWGRAGAVSPSFHTKASHILPLLLMWPHLQCSTCFLAVFTCVSQLSRLSQDEPWSLFHAWGRECEIYPWRSFLSLRRCCILESSLGTVCIGLCRCESVCVRVCRNPTVSLSESVHVSVFTHIFP